MNSKKGKGIPTTPDELADAIFGKDVTNVAAETIKEPTKLTLENCTRTFKGGYGVYVISDNKVELKIDPPDVFELNKETLADLIEELMELGGLMQ